MRNLFPLSRFALIFALIMTAVSCAPEEEEEPEPTITDDRDMFVHSNGWSCAENSSQSGPSTFTVHINKSTTNSSQIFIENFYNFGFQNKATATVSGSSFTIASQQLAGNTIQGNGTMQANGTVTMNYTVNSGSAIDTCTATLTKIP